MAMGMKEIELAQLAGLVDGEGTLTIIGWDEETCTGTPRIEITNTDPSIIQWVMLRYGGNYTEYSDKNPEHKTRLMWYRQGQKAIDLVKQLTPFLISKKQNVAICLIQFYDDGERRKRRVGTQTWLRLTEAERIRRRNIYWEIRSYNKKGRGWKPTISPLGNPTTHSYTVEEMKRLFRRE